MKPKVGYIVIYDDGDCVTCPAGWNADCPGAIEFGSESVAFFQTHQQARKAVRISTAHARLLKEQGKIANEDFLGGCLKNVKIMPLT